MHARLLLLPQVNRIKDGGFAAKCAEIASGDVIESVDGQKCKGISQSELGALIMGAEVRCAFVRTCARWGYGHTQQVHRA
jgi:C-terminal processing protease CtpA/Prc